MPLVSNPKGSRTTHGRRQKCEFLAKTLTGLKNCINSITITMCLVKSAVKIVFANSDPSKKCNKEGTGLKLSSKYSQLEFQGPTGPKF